MRRNNSCTKYKAFAATKFFVQTERLELFQKVLCCATAGTNTIEAIWDSQPWHKTMFSESTFRLLELEWNFLKWLRPQEMSAEKPYLWQTEIFFQLRLLHLTSNLADWHRWNKDLINFWGQSKALKEASLAEFHKMKWTASRESVCFLCASKTVKKDVSRKIFLKIFFLTKFKHCQTEFT